MAWLQLILETDKNSADQLSELLEKFGAISVSLSAANEQEIYGQEVSPDAELWDRTRVTAQLHHDMDLDILLICIRDQIGAAKIYSHRFESLKDRDWIKEYQKDTRPLLFGDRLCICPGWCDPPENIDHVLILDPGLAFGTGSHTTTALCLEWLACQQLENRDIIDYGCGSGILALAALKLGAKTAYAIDIDPQALRATRDNASRNQLNEQITISHPDEIELPAADLLIANILSGPLVELSGKLASLIKPQGYLALSGILAVQVEDCLSAYNSWFNMEPPRYRNEWSMLTGTRK